MFFFASDLHGRTTRYAALESAIRHDLPDAVFLGGDLLPGVGTDDFIRRFVAQFTNLRDDLAERYPAVFLILGNDDPRAYEPALLDREAAGLWRYVHGRSETVGAHRVYGYAFVPPTPFELKDWERYDVSRFVDAGCISPEEGFRTVNVELREIRNATMENDLEQLIGSDDVADAMFLFHAPPYHSSLDRAALDGIAVDHTPLDVHVGSVAIARFIEEKQPLVTMHGHVHESARLTGKWMDRIGRTVMLGGAHDGPELSLIRFDPASPQSATRELL